MKLTDRGYQKKYFDTMQSSEEPWEVVAGRSDRAGPNLELRSSDSACTECIDSDK